MIPCDGCGSEQHTVDLAFESADGHEARYCAECASIYRAWVAVCFAREQALNRMLDVFIAETRQILPLRFVPQDFPRAPVSLPLAVLG